MHENTTPSPVGDAAPRGDDDQRPSRFGFGLLMGLQSKPLYSGTVPVEPAVTGMLPQPIDRPSARLQAARDRCGEQVAELSLAVSALRWQLNRADQDPATKLLTVEDLEDLAELAVVYRGDVRKVADGLRDRLDVVLAGRLVSAGDEVHAVADGVDLVAVVHGDSLRSVDEGLPSVGAAGRGVGSTPTSGDSGRGSVAGQVQAVCRAIQDAQTAAGERSVALIKAVSDGMAGVVAAVRALEPKWTSVNVYPTHARPSGPPAGPVAVEPGDVAISDRVAAAENDALDALAVWAERRRAAAGGSMVEVSAFADAQDHLEAAAAALAALRAAEAGAP